MSQTETTPTAQQAAEASQKPQLPPPKVDHVYAERGAGGSKTITRSS